MLGVPAASSAPLWVLDSIALTDLVTSGREAIPDWVPQNGRLLRLDLPRWIPHEGFSNHSRLNTRSRVLEPKCHSHDICGNDRTVCVCVVCVMSLHHTGVYVCNVSTSLPNKGAPQDK